MIRLEITNRIMNQLDRLTDAELQDLLNELENDIKDENIEVITYGADDTAHLLNSSSNSEDLQQAIEEFKGKDLLMPETKYAT